MVAVLSRWALDGCCDSMVGSEWLPFCPSTTSSPVDRVYVTLKPLGVHAIDIAKTCVTV